MALSDDEKWILPENLKRQEKEETAKVERGEDGSQGDLGSYHALLTGKNTEWVKAHAISDEGYVASYAAQLERLLIAEGVRFEGGISLLDVGCGPGLLTWTLSRSLPNCRAKGIDISASAIEYGRKRFPDCRFDVVTVDGSLELGERFSVVHARGFYPFNRTSDINFHREYMEALARHVKESGVLVLTLLSTSRSLAVNAAALTTALERAGMTPLRRVTLASAKIPGWVPLIAAQALTELLSKSGATHFYVSRRVRPAGH
ncbi:MAG: class I SAM-dependent methyltransferase [Elusimicrobiota bacterium]